EVLQKQMKVTEKRLIKTVCFKCNRLLKGLLTQRCKCGHSFCSKHLFYDKHDCQFDYKGVAKQELTRKNPQIIPRRIGD
ncbi:AN1-type zinc finger domain-containing protein, partial [Xylella fastidiosa]|uniref:AN1-type zinc finger domain-containing protein n=1 Tax=Xylella fastidiosa TaxID=2371 RepID=UPI001F26CBB3